MSSIHNIPEPTTGYRPIADDPAPAPSGAEPPVRRPDCAGQQDTSRPATEVDEELGTKTWLFMVTLSGLLLRGLLLYFGRLGLESDTAASWTVLGGELLAQGPRALDGQLPVYPLIMAGLNAVGIPLGVMPIVQAVLGVLAIPTTYAVARQLTGRNFAGLGAAALMAIHPGVLAWTTAAAPSGLGCALVAIGLYLLLRKEQNGDNNPWPGSVVLAVAALTAPAAWLVGLGAACGYIALGERKNRILCAAIALAMCVGPIALWASFFGPGLTQQMSATASVNSMPHLAALADQSLDELGKQLRFSMEPNGVLTCLAEGRSTVPAVRDPVADLVGDTWVALNAIILFAAAISLPLLLVRRRYAAAAMLAIPLLILITSGLALGEPDRMALFAPMAILAFAGLCIPAVAHLTDEEREAIHHEKVLKKQQKLEAKQQRREEKHGLYAFDKPKQRKASPKTAVKIDSNSNPNHPQADPDDAPPPVMSRPI